MKYFWILLLVITTTAHAFSIEPGVTQPKLVVYNCTPDLEPAFLAAFQKWNVALDGYFTLVKQNGPTYTLSISNNSVLPLYLGYTTFGPSSATIIQINTNLAAATNDLDATMLHEVGHALGMAHSSDTSAIMYPVLSWGKIAVLSNDDIAGIKSIYQYESPLTVLVSGRGRARTFEVIGKLKVNWNFGDGVPVSSHVKVRHHFSALGSYYVTASVGAEFGWVQINIIK